MLIALHKNARTTPAVRAEIAASTETAVVLAQRYGVGPAKPRRSAQTLGLRRFLWVRYPPRIIKSEFDSWEFLLCPSPVRVVTSSANPWPR